MEVGMNKERGFSLIEIMIVVAVIAILAGIAVPQYQDFVIRGELVEAHSGLAAYRVQMEQYYQDNRNYGPGACGVGTGTPPQPAFKYFSLSCVLAGAGQGFTATMTGSTPRTTGFRFTINEQNVRATPASPGNWGTATNCFIVRKGSC
jgi:prepilin-type N-terminal cleavage/methylation domain-containing protein